MCCHPGRHYGFQATEHPGACFCGCEGPAVLRPRFMSKKQKIARLKQHLENLQDEARAVEETIAQIKKEK